MIRVVLLGYGNVGQHLYQAMNETSGISVLQVYNRTPIGDDTLNQTQDISKLVAADVYLIAVPDHAISEVSRSIPKKDTLVAHTSGAVALNALEHHQRQGVFYPLQTFSKDRSVSFKTIPICIEAEQNSDLMLLERLGKLLSDKVIEISSEERKILHLAAVFVNNFVNHMYSVAADISETNKIDFNLLKPLIMETAKKIQHLAPKTAQTGPAKRNDRNTIEAHMALLSNNHHKAMYEQLTSAILHYHTTKK